MPPASGTLLHFLQTHALPPIRPSPEHSRETTIDHAHPRTDMRLIELWEEFEGLVLAKGPSFSSVPFSYTSHTPKTPITRELTFTTLVMLFCTKFSEKSPVFTWPAWISHPRHWRKQQREGRSDRIFRKDSDSKPLCTIEYKTPWSLKRTEDLPCKYLTAAPPSTLRKAVDQVYGYMTVNWNPVRNPHNLRTNVFPSPQTLKRRGRPSGGWTVLSHANNSHNPSRSLYHITPPLHRPMVLLMR